MWFALYLAALISPFVGVVRESIHPTVVHRAERDCQCTCRAMYLESAWDLPDRPDSSTVLARPSDEQWTPMRGHRLFNRDRYDLVCLAGPRSRRAQQRLMNLQIAIDAAARYRALLQECSSIWYVCDAADGAWRELQRARAEYWASLPGEVRQ